MTQIVDHRVGLISLENNIYRLKIREGADIDLKDAQELTDLATELTKDLRVGALVDAGTLFTISAEARSYFAANTSKQQFLGVAVITNVLAQRLIVNFYIKINRPNVPTRLFGNEEQALAWLQEIISKASIKNPR